METNKIQAGKQYKARAIKAQWGNSKGKGTLGCEILFEVHVDDFVKVNRFHQLWFTEKTAERNMDTLVLCGIYDMVESKGTQQFEVQGKDVLLTFKEEEYTNDKGETKTALKVQWINDPEKPFTTASSSFNEGDVKVAKALSSQLNLSALLKAARAEARAAAPKVKEAAPPAIDADSEVPF